jgi:hypothetical protein
VNFGLPRPGECSKRSWRAAPVKAGSSSIR